MKKVFTILFIIVVLLSGMTVRYSAHYCQGSFIASKLSLSGKNADCGMDHHKSESKDARIADLMCVNEITNFSLSSDYVYAPQAYDSGKDFQLTDFPALVLPQINSIPASPEFIQFPPGTPGLAKAECEVLCVFRI
jgi:hypothetical protein